MNWKKIIKVYFVFVMMISSIGALTINDQVKGFMLSVLHSGGGSMSSDSLIPQVDREKTDDGFLFSVNKSSDKGIIFEMNSDPSKRFAVPGAQNSAMLSFDIKTNDDSAVLKSLKLKISGVAPDMVDRAVLARQNTTSESDEEKWEVVEEGILRDEYFVFRKINFEVPENSSDKLYLLIDLDKDLTTGKRIRMDIEKPEDAEILVGGEEYEISAYYPLEGAYLTVARPRPARKK